MNKTKRTLELIAAIFSIVLGALLSLGSIIILGGINVGFSGADQSIQSLGDMLKIITIIILIGSIAIVILGSLLCVPPQKLKNRIGLQIALTIMVGIIAVFELLGNSLLYFILFSAPFVLLIISMCLRNRI